MFILKYRPMIRYFFLVLLFLLNQEGKCSIISSNEESIFRDILPCLINITSRYYKNTNFLFIAEEMRSLTSTELLFQSMPGTVMIQGFEDFSKKFGFFLFFPDSIKSYRTILKNIQSFTYNRFFIIWPTNFNATSINQLVSQFWEFKLLNVVILGRESEHTFNVYTYDPYTMSFCNKPRLILMDVWQKDRNTFVHGNDLYPLAQKLKNLNGCKLVCFAKNRPPDSIVMQEENGSWILDGIGGKLLEEVHKRINFTPVIDVPKLNVSVDKYGYDISHGFPELVTSLLDNTSLDLAFGIYSHIIYDNPKTEFSTTAVSECYGWAVPAHSGKEISVWMNYTQEFELTVWSLILVEYIVSVIVFYVVLRSRYNIASVFRSLHFVALHVFSLNLGVSAVSRIKYSRVRVFSGIIILYSLVISSAYQSSLGSFVTVPWRREQIKSFQEILDAGYVGIGVPQGKRILERFSADNKALNALSKHFRVHTDHFDSLVLRIQQKKDTVTFGAQRFVQFYIYHHLNNTGRDDVYLLPKCVIQAHASPFLFKKGSPFLKPINNIISAAVESGLTNFWYRYSTPKISSPFAEILPLTTHQLESAFDILIIGNCLAIITFIAELRIYRMKNSSKRINIENRIVVHKKMRSDRIYE